MIAGPNGAGKTTFARSFLPAEANCLRFINADLIAAGLSPFAPELVATNAARLMLKEMAECSDRRESFGLETTLATRSYIPRICDWKIFIGQTCVVPRRITCQPGRPLDTERNRSTTLRFGSEILPRGLSRYRS